MPAFSYTHILTCLVSHLFLSDSGIRRSIGAKKHGQGLSAHNYCKDHRTNNFLNSISRYRIFVVMDNCMSVDRRISLSVIRSAGMIAVITVDSTWKKDLLHTQSPYINCETVESFAISFKRGLASCVSVHECGRLSLGEFHNWHLLNNILTEMQCTVWVFK